MALTVSYVAPRDSAQVFFLVWSETSRMNMVWYGMVWYGMVWYGMVWYGM